jgi:hypothetical protein
MFPIYPGPAPFLRAVTFLVFADTPFNANKPTAFLRGTALVAMLLVSGAGGRVFDATPTQQLLQQFL